MKRFASVLIISTFIFSLVGCNSSQDKNYQLKEEGSLRSDFTSFKSTNQNNNFKNDNFVIANKSYPLKKTYNTYHTREANEINFNYLDRYIGHDFLSIKNLISGLAQYDKYGNLVGDLAIGYKLTKNDDGTESWQFQLRENAEWVDNKTGKKYADVTAEDFVTAIKYAGEHMNSSVYGNIRDDIVGLKEYAENYFSRQNPNFDNVGVKAIDKYVIEYQTYGDSMLRLLSEPELLLPVNKTYLEQQGDLFGSDYHHILINGAFRLKDYISKDHLTLEKNYHYYDRDNVHVDKINSYYVTNKNDADVLLDLFNNNKTDAFTINDKDAQSIAKYITVNNGSKEQPGNQECVSSIQYGTATMFAYFNLNRTSYDFECNDFEYTPEIRKATSEAVLNTNFRKAFLYGLNLLGYLDNSSFNLNRSLNNKGINQTNGKDYLDYLNEYYNQKNNTNISLIGLDSGNDPLFDTVKAQYYFNLAKEELLLNGITGPIYLDVRGSVSNATQSGVKQLLDNIEDISDGFVKFNYETPSYGDKLVGLIQSDFIISEATGPDYYDPTSVLDMFNEDNLSVTYLGFNQPQYLAVSPIGEYLPTKYQNLVTNNDYSEANKALRNDVFGSFDAKLKAAKEVTDLSNLEQRYRLAAEAEYELLYENAVIIPYYSSNKYIPSVSRVIPYQKNYKQDNLYYKNIAVSKNVITQDDYQIIYSYYLNEAEED